MFDTTKQNALKLMLDNILVKLNTKKKRIEVSVSRAQAGLQVFYETAPLVVSHGVASR